MAVPAFRAAGAGAVTANSVPNPATLAPSAPAGRVVGDLLVGVTWSRSNSATVATPSGWNTVSGFPVASGTASGGKIYVFTRVADGTASDNISCVWTGLTTGTSGDTSVAVILAWQNALETLDGTVQSSDLAAQTSTSVIPAFTTGTNNSIVIGLAIKLNEQTGQSSTVATFTERLDAATTNGNGVIVEVCDLAKTGLSSAGSSGTATITWSSSTSARALTASLGFKSPMPTGAAAEPETLTITSAGVRKALGAAARSLALAITTAGVRKTFGAAARNETITFVAAGVRKTFGAAARNETITFTAAGTRTTFGSAALNETIGFTCDGAVTTPATPTVTPGGGTFAITPRQHKYPKSGKFRSRAVRIVVTAPPPSLKISLNPVITYVTARAAAPAATILFAPTANEWATTYTRKRPADMNERIRTLIISDA